MLKTPNLTSLLYDNNHSLSVYSLCDSVNDTDLNALVFQTYKLDEEVK